MTNPKFEYSTVAYFRESAALGFLEAVQISGVYRGKDGWLYTINVSMTPPSVGSFQDRRSLINTQILYYSEDELVTKCEALVLAEASTKAAYDRVRLQRQTYCPDDSTSGTS